MDAGIDADAGKPAAGMDAMAAVSDAGDSGVVHPIEDAGANTDASTATDASFADADANPGVIESDDLTCKDGAPSHLPKGVELIVSDVYDSDDYYTWTVSKNVLTWTAGEGWPDIWHQSLQGDTSRTKVALEPEMISFYNLGAFGADTVIDARTDGGATGPSENFTLRVLPAQGPALNLAPEESGDTLGHLHVDADSVYWMYLSSGMFTLWSSPRDPGDSKSLGSMAVTPTDQSSVRGPVVIGDAVYVATTVSGKGQVFRATKDGATQLAAFGPELPGINALSTDGTDLLLLLDQVFDALRNPTDPPRIARMNSEGSVTDVAEIAEPGLDLTFNAGMIYWTSRSLKLTDRHGSIWSVAADGSSAPEERVHVQDSWVYRHLFSNDGDVYFDLGCSYETENASGDKRHLMRLRP